MSLEAFLDGQTRAVNYTKPCQLPTNIAFTLLKWEMETSKFDKKKTPKVTVKADDYVDLAVWIGARHAHISDTQVDSLNKSISEGKKFYIVARLFSKQEQVPIDLLTEEKKIEQGLEDFDGKSSFHFPFSEEVLGSLLQSVLCLSQLMFTLSVQWTKTVT